MSLFSVVNIMFVVFVLPCIFFFHPLLLLLGLLVWFFTFLKLVGMDLCGIKSYHKVGFWLFLLSEVIVFGSLLTCCLWFQGLDSECLAYAYFIPLVETVLLVGSSFFISAYHCLVGSSRGSLYLLMSLFSALLFMFLAVYEILGSVTSSLFNPHTACCFMTVGLHFSHVLIGSLLLVQLLYFPVFHYVRRNSDMYIIYWHFVDYVWLFVFSIVYLSV
uniref:Cytochrome c oxidase subunit 3 n=1 Tax=Trichobilharzia szidati TaxID=157070 RepID=A0A343QZ12_9TREM|nr:cytochrome c oxidase subunit III [Trichobilharzia szidati]ATV95725.1 cytochrome c oxidase subunit III [Trichobilharzia szidati]